MIQVKVVASGSGQEFDFGPPVRSLREAKTVVRTLDWVWTARESKYTKEKSEGDWPTWFDAIDYYEGCDIYAKLIGTDKEWVLNENNRWIPWGIDYKPE